MKLTIAIPTFNRKDRLMSVLNELCRQIHFFNLRKEVEVCVIDDSRHRLNLTADLGAFDGIVRYYHFTDFERANKIGFDAATIELVELANGEYVQYLSDDDELLPCYLQILVKVLTENPDCGVVWSNHYVGPGGSHFHTFTPTYQDILPGALLKVVNRAIGFMPAYCFRRDIALRYLWDSKGHVYGFCFAFLYHVLPILAEGNRLILVRVPQLVNRPSSNAEIKESVQATGFNSGYHVYCEYLPDLILKYVDVFGYVPTYRFIVTNLSQYLKGMILGYIGGWDDPRSHVKSMLCRYWWFPTLYLYYIPLFFLPKKVLEALYRFERLLKRKSSTLPTL